ncbi:cell division protein FtsA [Paramaledivibacter caminithermalis]|jgi:cell division protein FtsA|uniref:Cell division protein FtsA n=1 Tax=Paramaledivibacter caminithermalis (strain DSM 15212 / CIP 107654 / DViRD3) TaxID=1121301 RepID=A0A1M6MM60_PARC5|nr:cell division FtsA domain-containing protein [Paramaledivibacter caminithermalis]SHJ84542.1 cell division protein FtsA [Paramaledivibacter caminithermalis DSM 15212]
MEDVIFSLDIGTRNVVGILAKMEDDVYKVIDYEILEHPDRSMYDGQIHDVEKVTEVAKEVKEKLEERNGEKLKYVAIAAAGRALKTQKTFVENEVDSTVMIDKSIINSLELHGIQMAQEQLESECNDRESRYYCVGYTVVNYYLDGSIIGNLKGHRGKKIGAEVLATFLPHVVVDSLYTVVHNIGLEVINLTLEPIAAINIAIPQKFRLLNLALVDIGAGTSDIAITKNGTISSYAMVSFAGDEITEALAQAFLLDFITAEKLKIELGNENNHTFNDVVGIEYNLSTDEIISKIDKVIKELSEEIAEKIVEYNGKPPSAVFCIGGGSQIPKLRDYLSERLELPKERVVIKGIETLEKLEFVCQKLNGPEYITPLGIGYTTFKDKDLDFLNVTVNEKPVRLFNSKELSVSDALLLVGFSARKLIAKKGKSISIMINGDKKVFHGSYGESAKIYVNGKIASLDKKLKNDDHIFIEEATPGKEPVIKIKDLVNFGEKVLLDDKEIELIRDVKVNGQNSHESYILKNNDNVRIERIRSIKEILEINNIKKDKNKFFVNDILVDENYILKDGDVIRTEGLEEKNNTVIEEICEEQKKNKSEYIKVNVNGKDIELENKDKNTIFVEIFNHIDFDLKNPKGILELRLNGNRANYTDILKDGDNIEIFWK